MFKVLTFRFNPFRENSYLVWDETGNAAIIDPGFYDETEASALYSKIKEKGITPTVILLTHAHFDHIYGVSECASKYDIPVMMAPQDKEILEEDGDFAVSYGLKRPDVSFNTTPLADGQIIKVGNTDFQVIATPGHSPGGVCFYVSEANVLFSGDTLFAGSIGRTDNLWGDYDKLIVSIMDKIMGLPGNVTVFPGHGHQTGIAEERTHNPFLQPFNELDTDVIDWDTDGIELHGAD